MSKTGLIAAAGLAVGLSLSMALATTDAQVLGWSHRAPLADADTPTATSTPTNTLTPTLTPTPKNHGQYVSDVARDTEPGPGHGQAVSEAARDRSTPTATQVGSATATATTTATATPTPTGSATATPVNHGQYVSDVARSTEPGPDHGRIVSEAAKSDIGKKHPGDSTDDDQSVGAGTPTATPMDGRGHSGKPPKPDKDVEP